MRGSSRWMLSPYDKGGELRFPPPLIVAIWSCTPCRIGLSSLLRPAGSSQATLRRPGVATYRCFLPDLTGFIGSRRAGPNFQHHLAAAVLESADPRGGIRPRCSGLRVQGTASSPSSTTVDMLPHKQQKVKWRRGWDSNPRCIAAHTLSRRAHSARLCNLSTWCIIPPSGESFKLRLERKRCKIAENVLNRERYHRLLQWKLGDKQKGL